MLRCRPESGHRGHRQSLDRLGVCPSQEDALELLATGCAGITEGRQQ